MSGLRQPGAGLRRNIIRVDQVLGLSSALSAITADLAGLGSEVEAIELAVATFASADGAAMVGTANFGGDIIPDGSSVQEALQALETTIETGNAGNIFDDGLWSPDAPLIDDGVWG